MTLGAEHFATHLERPLGRGHTPAGAFTGAAGGAACGDLIRISLTLEPGSERGRIADAGFDASGCGATTAAGSATVALLRGASLLDAARIGAGEIADELGGLAPAKRHAAELAADALHRALGAAARSAELAGPDATHERTLVAMSGGVDSAVAALLVAQESEAIAVTLELWSDPENDGDLSCCSAQAVRGARALAHSLGLPHFSIDLRAEFREGVVDHWLEDHAAGLTPNPCVRCNGNVRLDAMLELGDRLGAQTLATGHYARVIEREDGAPMLQRAADPGKDQSYVLCALGRGSLARMRFPLGELHKPQVRELAREAGLPVAERRDSQDLCFLAGTRSTAFLARHGGMQARPGRVLDGEGNVLGEHAGAHGYTVGQRRGLRLNTPEPRFVLATDTRANTITVGEREQLLSDTLIAQRVTLNGPAESVDAVRVRAHGALHPCSVPARLGTGSHEQVVVSLARPAERTAPGQVACLYAGDVVVGHGTIAP